jgi:hypothetical protein
MVPSTKGRTRRSKLEVLVLFIGAAVLLHASSPVSGQITSYPFIESFDSATPPDLPPGWSSSRYRNPASNDFTLTPTLPYSEPNAVLSTNASIEQWLTSPLFDFSDVVADTLTFYVRRSSSHRAVLIIEASLDEGETFPVQFGDSLTNTGTTSYMLTTLPLPAVLNGNHGVRFRWRLVPDQGGVTGTLRIDDLKITVVHSYDLALARLTTLPQFPRDGDSVLAYAVVRNAGVDEVQGFSVECFSDANADSLPQADELIASVVSMAPLVSGDSITIAVPLGTFPAGDHPVIAIVVCERDQTMHNNLLQIHLLVGHTRNSVVVNEIMFHPLVGESEYVELANVSGKTVDLLDWAVADRSSVANSAPGIPLANESRILHPGEFFVLGADSSLFQSFPYLQDVDPRLLVVGGRTRLHLNNEGDDVVVRDRTGCVVDSVAYLPSWHNRGVDDPTGRSLEKIRPKGYSNDARNWSSCALPAGGTPAKVNSINAIVTSPNAAQLSVYPNPFSPDGDGIEDFALIRYQLPLNVAMLSLRVFDARGRLIRHLANNEPTGSQGEIVWDGCDDDGRRARIGPYVLYLEALDGTPGIIETARAIVVLATRL